MKFSVLILCFHFLFLVFSSPSVADINLTPYIGFDRFYDGAAGTGYTQVYGAEISFRNPKEIGELGLFLESQSIQQEIRSFNANIFWGIFARAYFTRGRGGMFFDMKADPISAILIIAGSSSADSSSSGPSGSSGSSAFAREIQIGLGLGYEIDLGNTIGVKPRLGWKWLSLERVKDPDNDMGLAVWDFTVLVSFILNPES